MKWVLKIVKDDNEIIIEEFDPDEIGTIDEIWTAHMIVSMDGVQSFTLTKMENL